MPEQSYLVHSMVRKPETRMHRAMAAQHHRFVTKLAGGDIVVRRARPTVITEAKLQRHLAELRKAEEEGKIRVTTGRGIPVDLSSLTIVPVVEVSKPLPNPPLDSAANDRTYGKGVGMDLPQHLRGGSLTGKAPLPTTLAKLTEDMEDMPIAPSGDPALLRKKQAQAEPVPDSDEDADDDLEEELDEDGEKDTED